MRDEDLTPEEQRALDTLPREKMPSAGLEERVVGSLRSRGVLSRRRRSFELTRPRMVAAVAASIALMIGGFSVGQWTTLRQVSSMQSALLDSGQLNSAASLQYAATAYLMALENLEATPDPSNPSQRDDAQQGREVAVATLTNAANQVSRFVPREYLAGQLLQAIEMKGTGASAPSDSALIWF